MRPGRPKISVEVRREVELAVLPRLQLESDKQLVRRLNISRSSIYSIMREVRERLEQERLKQMLQSGK